MIGETAIQASPTWSCVVVVIIITDFVGLGGERFHSVFQALERHDHEALTDHFELHFVQLPKLTALRTVAEGRRAFPRGMV